MKKSDPEPNDVDQLKYVGTLLWCTTWSSWRRRSGVRERQKGQHWTMAMESSCKTHMVGESHRILRLSSWWRATENLSSCCRDESYLRTWRSKRMSKDDPSCDKLMGELCSRAVRSRRCWNCDGGRQLWSRMFGQQVVSTLVSRKLIGCQCKLQQGHSSRKQQPGFLTTHSF